MRLNYYSIKHEIMNVQHIRFIILGILTLAISACSQDENTAPTYASNGSRVELSFEGNDYNFDGTGMYQTIDTTFTIDGEGRNFKALNCSISQKEKRKGFSFIIFGYDGVGAYPFWKYDIVEYSGLFSLGYTDLLNNVGISSGYGFPNQEEGVITITNDNNREITGTLSVDAYLNSNFDEVSKLTGEFTIKK